MPVPDFESLMLPALKALADGVETPLSEVRARIAAAEGLTSEDLREMLPGVAGRHSCTGLGGRCVTWRAPVWWNGCSAASIG